MVTNGNMKLAGILIPQYSDVYKFTVCRDLNPVVNTKCSTVHDNLTLIYVGNMSCQTLGPWLMLSVSQTSDLARDLHGYALPWETLLFSSSNLMSAATCEKRTTYFTNVCGYNFTIHMPIWEKMLKCVAIFSTLSIFDLPEGISDTIIRLCKVPITWKVRTLQSHHLSLP